MGASKRGWVRWIVVFWLFVLSAVAYLDRVNLSIAGSFLAKDFGLNNVQLGQVFSAFLGDMTDLRRTEQQLQQVQKLEAVGQLTAGIAHDFNNMLSIVVGNLEIALEDMNTASKNAQVVTRALNAALHGAELTHRLLAFARQQALEPKTFLIDDLLPDVVTVLKRTLGAGIAINHVPGKGVWPAYADPSQVQDAVLNLAINARDAMPHGGTLTIETANISLDEDYSRSNPDVTPGDYALLAVTDTGTGISPEIKLAHSKSAHFAS